MITTVQAIQSLRPNSQFVITGDDVESIVWHTDDEPLTKKQVTDEIKRLEAEAAAKVNARTAALAKLAALGLTAEEVAAL